jgi:hypothetical protein
MYVDPPCLPAYGLRHLHLYGWFRRHHRHRW